MRIRAPFALLFFRSAIGLLSVTLLLACAERTHLIRTYDQFLESDYRNGSRTASAVVNRVEPEYASGLLTQTCMADRIDIFAETEVWATKTSEAIALPGVLGVLALTSGIVLLAVEGESSDEPVVDTGTGVGIILGGVALISVLLFVDGSGETEDVGWPREQPAGRQAVACSESGLPPVSGQLAQLTSGDDRHIADVSIDAGLGFRFTIQSLTAEEAASPRSFELHIPNLALSAPLSFTDPTALARAYQRTSETRQPPDLTSSAALNDAAGNGNGVLDPGESAEIQVLITNDGSGDAYDVAVVVAQHLLPDWLSIAERTSVGDIEPGEFRTLTIPVVAAGSADEGLLEIGLEVVERGGFDAPPLRVQLQAGAFEASALTVAGFAVFEKLGDGDGVIEVNEVIALNLTVRNESTSAVEGQVRVSSLTVGYLQDQGALRRDIEPGGEAVFAFDYILPAGDAGGVSAIDAVFDIVDLRTSAQQPFDGTFELGTEGIAGLVASVEEETPTQRVFLMEQSEETLALVGTSISALHESLTEDGSIAIANAGEAQTAMSMCAEMSGPSPTARRECELEWANRSLYDWAILLYVEHDVGGDVLIMRVYDPHSAETVFSPDELVNDGQSARAALQAHGDNFRRWLRRRRQ